ncbi:MAG: formylglycine-generating enzyme family protein [Acidobacteriota bacterium]
MKFRVYAWIALLALGACSTTPPGAWREPVTGIEFLYVPPGSFRMGSEREVPGRQADETAHEVTLTRGFYLGKYEVTQQQWITVMEHNPSQFQDCGLRCPVETVSYLKIREFIDRLQVRSPGNRFRLPTEAEWEFACRAGTDTAFSTGNHLSTDQANFDGRFPYADQPPGTYLGSPSPVGSYPPNPWGFYDLHGNVWEWCADWYAPYPAGALTDPGGPAQGELHVIRGGSWYFDANSARSALRYTHRPQDDGFSLGFRLVREVGPSAPAPKR